MCGIAGVLDLGAATDGERLRRMATGMSEAQTHRGPDANGCWIDPGAGIGLGFRRLAILDLSELGAQPMQALSGRWVVAFNGEIYNYASLRTELSTAGARFRGTSDTEVLVAAIDRWGFEEALGRCNGMFAIAAWDAEARRLHLARDRFGEKPLYYGWVAGRFVFASELPALRALDGFDGAEDPVAVAGYLALTHVPSPRTIHASVRTLPAGCRLVVDPSRCRQGDWIEPQRWWSIDNAIGSGLAAPFRGSVDEAAEAVDELLVDAVAMRLASDVPLGCFLSGGLDSSLVSALAAAAADGPVRTFTVRMPELGFDESEEAAAVAAHLGTKHTCVDLSVADALAVVPRLPSIYGEPFGDPSALPSVLVCAAARREVTVALGGDGGDEVFVGYNRYVLGNRLWRRTRRWPLPVRRPVGAALARLRPGTVDRLLGGRGPVRNPGDKVQKLANLLRTEDQASFVEALVRVWDPVEILAGIGPSPRADEAGNDPDGDVLSDLVRRDLRTTLPDQMLVKLDRASMAASLEARSPLVDHRLLPLVWSMPMSWHVDASGGKRLLRRALLRRVPAALVDRPKMGFDPPIGSWLRGPLRSWAGDLLGRSSVEDAGLRFDVIERHWREHQQGRANHDYRLWTVLQYLAWRHAT